ncbi:MAG: sensor histidine kinase [Planctomycetes bacterium]|nr:sensor histidine kinase [Planctomycetota bacterium]
MPQSEDHLHFEVHPSVVYQLGESLISDAVQAIIELVKNCYDADATYAKVVIDTQGAVAVSESDFDSNAGRILVEDDGHGMTEDAVTQGWLLISNRAKRDLKEAKKTTPGGRTPLGDKGLGRLGVQRLGDGLDVLTKTSKTSPLHFAFSWLDFATAPSLRDVKVSMKSCTFPRKHGTTVVVSNLREPALWRGQDSINRLTQDLSRMISPYKAIRDFVVYVEVDGKPLELLEVSEKVRDIAPIRYNIRFDGSCIQYRGRARLDFFRPDSEKEAEEFALIAESDHGDEFFKYLSGRREADQFHLKRTSSKKWYVEFNLERNFGDLDALETDPVDASRVANPGAFVGEVDSFDLGLSAFRAQGVFDALNEYRMHVKQLSGIRVYRDGFAIRVDQDWLKLGAGWTSARSYYGLKPDNTLGYIALSARDNMVLEETTDREGFKDTPYYRNFFALLQGFKSFATGLHTFFGRAWVDFKKARTEQLARVDTRKDVQELSRTIRTTVDGAGDQQASVEKIAHRIEIGVNKSVAVLGRLAEAERITPVMQKQARETLGLLESLVTDAKRIMDSVAHYLEELRNLRGIGQVLEDRVGSIRRQVDDMYEAVALGLTAEAIVHEVFQITDGLTGRTKRLIARSEEKVDAKAVRNYLEYVHSSTAALRRQVSFLSPALRYVREQREEFTLPDFLKELADFYYDRLAHNKIVLSIVPRSNEAFGVRMNRGKLTQVLGNFILNSEYWLREDIRQGRIDKGQITIELERPFLRVSDSGRGIDPSVETMLFEPFVTTKARGIGRGLGLFIVKQLLDADDCHVGILPQRNRSRRLYAFQIDLRGVLHE